jgi:hypothetical protein
MDDANPPSSKASTPETLAELLTRLRPGDLVALLESAACKIAAASSAPPPGSDILRGAAEIAEFLYGDRQHRRKVYNLVERGLLPHFKLGAAICSRKSVLLEWIAAQERGAKP